MNNKCQLQLSVDLPEGCEKRTQQWAKVEELRPKDEQSDPEKEQWTENGSTGVCPTKEAFMSKAALCGKNGEKRSLVEAQGNGKGHHEQLWELSFRDLNIFSPLTSEKSFTGDLGMEQVLRQDSNALMRMSRAYSG